MHGTGRREDVTRHFRHCLAFVALAAAVYGVPAKAAERAELAWVRVELVENTVEGPAYERCEMEGQLQVRDAHRWRLFYGEARADPTATWAPMRPGSGCWLAASDGAPSPWTLRGSPYVLVDVALDPIATSANEASLQASLTIRRLTAFNQDGKPAYEQRTEQRTLRVPTAGSAVIPILVASRQETEAFGVRELLLRFRSAVPGAGTRTEYGEIAVAADIPRAEIFLDGGFVGRTSSDGPVILRAVRVGEREILVKDPSGREARAVAHVTKGRTASLSLALLKGAPASADGLRPLGRNPQGEEEFWREKDGAIVVRIPGGEFQMGSPEGKGNPAEHPQHPVYVNAFLMDKTEVTWGQYQRFLAASGHAPPKSPIWGTPEAMPVSSLTWEEGNAFCAWAGGRLPTEAEWERAARGNDTREFPWGNTYEAWRCNTRDGGPHEPSAAAANPDCVGPYGVLDQAGSVSEWCSDWYAELYPQESSVNPTGPKTGTRRVSRGGNWMSPAFWVRVASRMPIAPERREPMQGFRCAQDDRKGGGQ
jgi:formylglycine-generating enzyme required for sulfatase activity